MFIILLAGIARAEIYRISPAADSLLRNKCMYAIEGAAKSETSAAPEKDVYYFAQPDNKKRRQSLSSRHGILMNRLVRHSLGFVGVPYRWSGTTSSGFDCSGFVWRMFSNFGIDIPRMADSQFKRGIPVSRSNLEPGDLVFFTTYTYGVSHVGIYIGNNKFVHSSSSRGVMVNDLDESYYAIRYVGARRL